jgi:hypothetical protein
MKINYIMRNIFKERVEKIRDLNKLNELLLNIKNEKLDDKFYVKYLKKHIKMIKISRNYSNYKYIPNNSGYECNSTSQYIGGNGGYMTFMHPVNGDCTEFN